MSELKEKKVKEEDIRMFEETKKKREEMQRQVEELPESSLSNSNKFNYNFLI